MKILVLLLLLIPTMTFSQEEKKYSEKEFKVALEKELEAALSRVKPGSVVDFSKELLKKEEEFKLKEITLKQKEEQLRLSEEEISKKLLDFQKTQERFIGCLDKNEQDKKKRVNHMVDVIAGMKPQNAADILSVQDSDISIRILGALPAEKVSKIFNLMNKEISARLQKQYMSMKK